MTDQDEMLKYSRCTTKLHFFDDHADADSFAQV